MTIEELFGTLQQSVVAGWRKHLKTYKYSKHMALDEFYSEMPEKVDALIEAWMGVNGKKVKSFTNIITSKNMGTLVYLKELRKVVKQGYTLMNGENELEALLDDIVELIDSTLYKVKELNDEPKIKENNMNLKDFLTEALVSEANMDKYFKAISSLYDDDGDLVSVASCFQWLEELGWAKMKARDYAKAVHDINDDIDTSLFMSRYSKCMVAMAEVGKEQSLDFIKQIATKEEIEDYLYL